MTFSFFYPPLTWVTQTPSLINFASWTPAPSLPQESLQEPRLLTCISAVAQFLTHLTLQLKNHFSFQFCAVFWEDPLCCHRDGFTLPQSKCPVLMFYFSHCVSHLHLHLLFSFLIASICLQRPALDAVHCSLRLLASSASRLQVECRKAAPSEPGAPAVDYQLLTQQVIQCAYDIAKAAKQLVTITTREKKQWPDKRKREDQCMCGLKWDGRGLPGEGERGRGRGWEGSTITLQDEG